MSYEQKARDAAATLTDLSPLPICMGCGGGDTHEPNCPTLRPALLENAAKPDAAALEEPLTLEQAKALHVARVLREKKGNRSAAARALAIDRRTLYHFIERYGIEVPSCNVK